MLDLEPPGGYWIKQSVHLEDTMNRMPPFLALSALLPLAPLLAPTSGCVRDRPAPEHQSMRIKLEWGSLDADPVTWPCQVSLSDADVVQAYPYELESGDTFIPESLRLYSWTEDYTTDGILLELSVAEGGSLTFLPGFGTPPYVLLNHLEVGHPVFVMVDDTRYLQVARLSEAEWNTALSYGRYEVSRTDALPRPAYERHALAHRYDSSTALEDIQAYADELMESDPFFAHAETIRQGVNRQLYVTAPSVLEVGESFDLTVAAFDIDGRLVEDFGEDVPLSVDGDAVVLPERVSFSSGEPSLVTLSGAGTAVRAGFALITATDSSGRFSSGSIPVQVEGAPGYRVYWGDLHTHTRLSDGDFGDIGPEDVYAFGRDVGRLDFLAITDHDYRRPIPDWKWPRHREAAEAFYEPGRFVTFLAYEWSAEDMRYSDAISHKNVYYRTTDAPIYSAWDPRYNTPDKLWAALRANPGVGNALTIPHHPVRKVEVSEEHPQYGGPGTDWSYFDDDLQTLVEVYSRWGISETTDPDNPRPVRDARDTGSAQEALAMGHLVGFMASSDTHDGKPGVSVLPARLTINDYPVGVVAIQAESLTRDALFDALVARRCYGTSGGRRILVDFRTTSGLRMGDVGRVEGSPAFDLTVAGTTDLSLVEILRVDSRGAQVVWTVAPSSWLLQARAAGDDWPSGGAYYLRVTQADGEMAWAGPIFLQDLDP